MSMANDEFIEWCSVVRNEGEVANCKSYIALSQCVCRHWMVMLGKSTQRPLPD